jgi:phage baseplate assembly protein W
VEHALAYALLDLVRAIRDDLPPALFADIMDAQLADLRPNLAHYGPAQDLAGLIRGRSLGANNTKLKALLRALQNSEDKLRQEFGPDDALSSLPELSGWQLADPNAPLLNAWVADQPEGSPLLAAYAKALQPYDPAKAPGALATYPDQPKLDPSGGVRYILRLVYERPQCCLPVLSAPTREFAIASFFDPDAPDPPADDHPPARHQHRRAAAARQGRHLRPLRPVAPPDGPREGDAGTARPGSARRGRAATGAGLLLLDPDHHDLRADPAADHGQPAEHHLLVAAVLQTLPAGPARGAVARGAMDEGSIFGRGIAFPPRVGPDGRWTWSQGGDNIRESIEIILLTNPGERLMLSPFGGGLAHYLFAPNTTETRRLIREDLQHALRRWEPRIAVREVTVEADPFEAERAIVTIDYQLVATQADDQLTLAVQLGR